MLHQRSEGWVAALQMAALSLRGTTDPARTARALAIRSHAIAGYFVAEVLDRQPPEVTRFMLDTSVLSELTPAACTAVTGRQDAAALLHSIDAANLFLIALDEERASFRYHHLVRQLLRAELRVRDPAREQELQARAAGWYEATGDARRASRYFLAARQADRALALLQDKVIAGYQRDPAQPPLVPQTGGLAGPGRLAWPTGAAAARPDRWSGSSSRRAPLARAQLICCCAATTTWRPRCPWRPSALRSLT
jgi:LuxR family transcriptional regulator, maltose regulon positive regulatory protein